MKKMLIFGALGRMGGEIIKALPADTPIRAADISIDGDYPENVEPFLFDINAPPADITPLFDEVERMFLLWPPGVDVKQSMAPLITAAAKHGVKQAVFLSILGADQLKIVPHRAVEQLLEASGMDWVFLRSAYFMQNLSGIHAPDIRELDEVFIPAGKGNIGLVDVRDVAAVGAKALLEGHKNVAYSLTGPKALTFKEVAEEFSQGLEKPIQYSNPNIIKFVRHMLKRGVPFGLALFMVIEYTATKLGKSGLVTNEIENVLGRSPQPLSHFIADYKTAWQA